MSMHAAPARAGTVSRALARDKLGVLAVLAFILASIAPMTVVAGVIPTAYALTGLAGIPAAFLVVAVVLALFCPAEGGLHVFCAVLAWCRFRFVRFAR